MGASIRHIRKQAQRLRRVSAVVGVLVLLSLGVLEPLLCIIHCNFLMSSMQHAQHAASAQTIGSGATYLCSFATQPSTDVMRMPHQPANAMSMPHEHDHGTATSNSASTPSHIHSPMADPSAPATYVPQPQAFHEMALVAMVLVFVVCVVLRGGAAQTHTPPQRFLRPPLRPPTASLRHIPA
jgi:hypothetical protein